MDFTLTAEQRELTFENARLPHANIVGEVNGNGRIRARAHYRAVTCSAIWS